MKDAKNKDTGTTGVSEGGKFSRILSDRYFKFGLAAFLYLLWTCWVGSWWLLLGLPVLFDSYVTKKVNWTFWKKREGANNKVIEWIDALIFAVIVVTLINVFLFQNYKIPTGSMEKTLQIGDHLFVSKLKYGPKIPNTPLSFPFAQHTMPLTANTKSYLEWIQWDYKRLRGLTRIKNNDIVVFNFPEGDTVIVRDQASSYYGILRRHAEILQNMDNFSNVDANQSFEFYVNMARRQILNDYEIAVRPVDRRDNYIKRCIAVPGDTIQIINTRIYINGKPQEQLPTVQFKYLVNTDGSRFNTRTLEKLDIYRSDVPKDNSVMFEMPLIEANVEEIRRLSNVRSVQKRIRPQGTYDSDVFPHNERYSWNLDNIGPLWIPQKGATVKIDTTNICLYQRIITAYEGNELQIIGGDILINGAKTDSYTFEMDYYWMMGDHRHDSLDSRFWGFVPEDHIVGAPRFVWLSLNKEKTFPFNIRITKMFRAAGK